MAPLAPSRWAQIDTLFDQALDRPPDVRTAWLRTACGDDAALYRAVVSLLAQDERGAASLGEDAVAWVSDLLAGADADPVLEPGTRLGPYRVEEEIGRGGMGVVYRAVRADGTFEQDAAIKVVKRGMDTDAVLERFRYERRVLAALDHPAIARLLDAGAAPDGRPWFAMERVQGEPVTAYAARRRLGLSDRLALIESIAEAVAYAHRNLVVHRDLKPSNVLVASGEPAHSDGGTSEGGEHAAAVPTPKLLDFGIARLLDSDADGALTRPGERVLTPEYAPPEQREGAPPSPAMDVYALGVIAYELLTGTRPGADPAPPSQAASPEAAAQMGTSPEALSRRLRGDLDTLLLGALRADPSRRYASGEAFLTDLRRWRGRLPLLARPDSLRYRAGRFVSRHRTSVAAAALVSAFLIGGALFSVARIASERDRARAERDRAEATASFVTDLFDAADPFTESSERPDTLRARDLLFRGADRARAAFADDPSTRAEVLTTIGDALIGLGLYAEADSLLGEAVRGARRSREASVQTRALIAQGRARYTGADPAESLPLLREAAALADQSDPDQAPQAYLHLGAALRRAGQYADAAAALSLASGAAEPLFEATVLIERGRVEQDRGRPADAEPLHRKALALRREALPDGHPQIAGALEMVGTSLLEQGRREDAEPVLREVLRLRRSALGDEHAQTASARFNLAAVSRDLGRYDEALAIFREVLAFDTKAYGADHPYVAGAWNEIGITQARSGNSSEAIESYRTALDIAQRTDADHPIANMALVGIGHELTQMGRAREGEPYLRRAVEGWRRVAGPQSWRAGTAQSALGGCLFSQGRMEEAERHLVEGYTVIRDADGPEGGALRRLVELYETTGREAEAEPFRQRQAELEDA